MPLGPYQAAIINQCEPTLLTYRFVLPTTGNETESLDRARVICRKPFSLLGAPYHLYASVP